ncbi:MAG TPA: hypothetical protein DD417_01365 [Elusimicrobia bacterium]|nr:hypothetical protein [Elusimicrobiota bacterium]
MKTKECLWTVILALTAAAAWAQPTPPGAGGDDMTMGEGAPGAPRGDRRMGPGGLGLRPGGMPDGPRGPEPAVTEDQERELLAFLKENMPKLHDRLSKAKQDSPMMYHHRLPELWQKYKDPEIRERFLKHAKALEAVRELSAQYKQAAAKDKAAVKEKLAKAGSELFDADLSNKEHQLKKMQEDIAKLKEKIARRRQLKEKIVAKRIEQLTGEDDDWE